MAIEWIIFRLFVRGIIGVELECNLFWISGLNLVLSFAPWDNCVFSYKHIKIHAG